MKDLRELMTALVLVALAVGCGTGKEHAANGHEDAADGHDSADAETNVVAELRPTAGNNVAGVVSFANASDGGVIIVAHITGLSPGKHGFHIHENGDCSAPDGTSAGGHFNPGGTPHGAPSNPAGQRHVGDLGNVEADASGTAHHETQDDVVSLDGPASIIGKAVILHGGEDDLTTQPTGAAGARLACGVIESS